MTRRKSRGNSGRFGLFDNGGAEVRDNPLLRPCPACGAAPRQKCTSPSRRRGGRRDLEHHFHDSRKITEPAEEAPNA